MSPFGIGRHTHPACLLWKPASVFHRHGVKPTGGKETVNNEKYYIYTLNTQSIISSRTRTASPHQCSRGNHACRCFRVFSRFCDFGLLLFQVSTQPRRLEILGKWYHSPRDRATSFDCPEIEDPTKGAWRKLREEAGHTTRIRVRVPIVYQS